MCKEKLDKKNTNSVFIQISTVNGQEKTALWAVESRAFSRSMAMPIACFVVGVAAVRICATRMGKH
jgi:uncharacterized membrane protein YoaK (UPF0700 family)